jgi:hypothetical protein
MTLDEVLRVVTAAMLVVTSVTGVVVAFRVNVVHKIVNQAHTDLMNYQRALIRYIESKGLDVPADQSVPDPVEPTDR